MGIRKPITHYIKKAKRLHEDKYDYSLIEPGNGSKDVVPIICPVHGGYMQQLGRHSAGAGCRLCADEVLSANKTLSTEDVVNQFKKVHGDLYDYSLVKYIGDADNVNIICKDHGSFSQMPCNHKAGKGCSKCASYGFSMFDPATLYYLRVERFGNVTYKIGITNRTVAERFGTDMQYITILKEWWYAKGIDAHHAEQLVLSSNKIAKYTGQDMLRSGNSELFMYDIGGYDE